MNKNFWVVILNFAVALMLALPLGAQSEDEVVQAEPRARRGGVIRLVFRNIPAEDKPNVDGEYQVSNDDGTVMLPYLASRVRVVGNYPPLEHVRQDKATLPCRHHYLPDTRHQHSAYPLREYYGTPNE